MAPAFYLRDMESFEHWKQQIKALKADYKQDCIFGMFDTAPFSYEDDSFDSDLDPNTKSIRKMSEKISDR
jgi:hypothetical protein